MPVIGQLSDVTAAVAAPVIRYYAMLDADNPEAAAENFAPDSVYVRPAKTGVAQVGQPKARQLSPSRGIDEVRAYILREHEGVRKAGRESLHNLVKVATVDNDCFVEGIVPSPDGGPDVVFFAHAHVNDDGLIDRYVAVVNEGPAGGVDFC